MTHNAHAQVLPFFFLNHRLEPARLRARIKEMHAAGCDGFFLHAREGLATPYLSKEWFAAVKVCLETARRRGMQAWLYDEMPYPSGVAGGEVVRRHPEFVEQSLRVERQTAAGGRRIEWRLGGGNVLACYARRRDGRRETLDLRADVGPMADTWRRTNEIDSKLYYPTGPAEVFDCPRSICVLPENVLATQLPRGRWDLVAVVAKTGGDLIEPFGNYVDVSNRAATQLFIELTHEAYARRFGSQFGRVIPGIFCDEPKFRNPLPWGEGVARAVGKISPTLAFGLGGDEGAAANEARRSYRRTTARAFRENWTQPLSQWCAGHKLALTGHISPEEEWWYESRHVGSVLANLRRFQVPGCDVIIPAAGDRMNALLNLTAGLAVSAAAQAGRPQALCEVFGACDFTLDVRTMKRMGDWLALAGINVAVPHGFLYSLDGYRKLDAPPSFAPPAYGTEDFAAWAEEFRRAAEQLGPGVAPDVLAIRPIDYLRGLTDRHEKKAAALLTRAARFATEMARRGLKLHWIDDDELDGVRAGRGGFRFGACRYRHLVFFRDFTDRDTLLRLAVLDAKGSVLDDAWALHALRGPLASDGDVQAARRSDGRWFVANVGQTPANFTLGAACGRLAGGESRVVDERMALTDPAPVRTELVLPDRWRVTRPKRNAVYLGLWTLNGRKVDLAPAFALEPGLLGEAGQTLFGPVPMNPTLQQPQTWVYRSQFKVTGRPELALVCESGHLRGEWTAWLNGRPLTRWRKGGDFLLAHALGRLVRPGVNRLEFRFTLQRSTDGLIGDCRLEGNVVFQRGIIGPAPKTEGFAASATTREELGLPFHGGPLRYSQRITFQPTAGKTYFLQCPDVAGNGATVRVNGRACGAIRWAPEQVDVTRALRSGSNLIELTWRGSPVVLTGRVDRSRLGGRPKLVSPRL